MASSHNSGVEITTQAQPSQNPRTARDTGVLLTAKMLQMEAKDIWGPLFVKYCHLHTKARLEAAARLGVTLDQIEASPTSGLITFPGINDATFLPKEARSPEPDSPQTTIDHTLWDEFCIYTNICARRPPLLEPTPRSDYLIHFVPIHLAYQLLPAASENPDWLSGKLKQGRISKEDLELCLKWAMKYQRDADVTVFGVMAFFEKFPLAARDKLGELFDKCSRPAIPHIFRHLFAGDSAFCRRVAVKLTFLYGVYEELDFTKLVLPLPATWEEEEPLMSRRAGAPEVGLIAFD
ncbi:hypothetical protein C8A01DRAFT_36022 [Parachaetomium inaequale]|uniref:Uncharacterized protein n=1 Tax=Parachaetomium inaequale TaxID=2588326 RepID=A0AAN6PG32_9PEZI|nr:hypothetical protein C8A01DRAFT_36022 [Parachaetomium inaequale]